jgi:hypothetical protein
LRFSRRWLWNMPSSGILKPNLYLTGDALRLGYRTQSVMLCNIWGFHAGDYEECRLLGYKNQDLISQETYYVSATEPSRLILCKIWVFHGGDSEECRLLRCKNPVRTAQETHYASATEPSRLMVFNIWGFHGGDYEVCRILEIHRSVLRLLLTCLSCLFFSSWWWWRCFLRKVSSYNSHTAQHSRRHASSPILVTLMKEAISSSEMSVRTRAIRRNISEDDIHHSHRRENLKSYKY